MEEQLIKLSIDVDIINWFSRNNQCNYGGEKQEEETKEG